MRLGLASDLHSTEKELFTGRVSDENLNNWRATASVFVSASSHEAFGSTVAEALSLGIPVVVSDIPAHREVLEIAGPRARAALVPAGPRAPTDFAREVQRSSDLGGDPLPRSMPSWDDVTAQTLAIYEQLARQRTT